MFSRPSEKKKKKKKKKKNVHWEQIHCYKSTPIFRKGLMYRKANGNWFSELRFHGPVNSLGSCRAGAVNRLLSSWSIQGLQKKQKKLQSRWQMWRILCKRIYSKTCVREPPSRLTLNSGWCGKSCLSYKVVCLSSAPPSHQPQSATSDQRSGVFIMRKECDAACGRDLCHDSSYTEPPAA